MRIQEVCKQTNLSKKAIYYYIDEKLISPLKNSENGYHEFTSEDVDLLLNIAHLRQMGMSIQTIKEVFAYPEMFNFFLHRHCVELKAQIKESLNQLNEVNYLLDAISPNATPADLKKIYPLAMDEYNNDEHLLEYAYPSKDSRIVAILLWGSFLEIRAGEYHQFLWSKMAKLLNTHLAEATYFISKLVYSLEPATIQEICEYQYQMSVDLQKDTPEIISHYVQQLVDACTYLATCEELQQYWKLTYTKFIIPLIQFHNEYAQSLMKEYNPRFSAYQMNLMRCTQTALITMSQQDPALLSTLSQKLNGMLNLKDFAHLELSAILIFKHSIYTALPLTKLQAMIETNTKD